MSQEPFGDIPLFREIQRLLSSSSGPVNLEIARQVALAVATQGAAEPAPDPAVGRALDDSVHRGEGLLSGYTRLAIEEPARVTVVTRAEWASSTLEGWSWLLEHLAERFAEELKRLAGQAEEGNPMQATLAQVGPLLSGMQAGTLVGQLSREALTRYDVPIPRTDDHRLTFVAPNLNAVMRDYDLERDPFLSWIALHETARHLLATSVPWLERYLRALLIEVVDAVEIDPADIERRFVELSSAGMEGVGEGSTPGNILPITPTERHGRAVRRLTSFLSVVEGYATSAVSAVAGEVLRDKARIDEGMARRRAAPGEGRAALETLLGITPTRAHDSAGVTFCAAVVKLKGVAALNRLWEAPDNLPLPEEIKDPFSWIERQGL